MEAKVITLIDPIEAHGEKIVQIIIEPPRAKQLRTVLAGSLTVGTLLDLASVCSGVPPSSIDLLSAADALRITEAMTDFLTVGPGENPSP